MSSNKELVWLTACLSSLAHDVRTAKGCLQYHCLNPFNPFSKRVRSRLQPLVAALDSLYVELSDPEFSAIVRDSLK